MHYPLILMPWYAVIANGILMGLMTLAFSECSFCDDMGTCLEQYVAVISQGTFWSYAYSTENVMWMQNMYNTNRY